MLLEFKMLFSDETTKGVDRGSESESMQSLHVQLDLRQQT